MDGMYKKMTLIFKYFDGLDSSSKTSTLFPLTQIK